MSTTAIGASFSFVSPSKIASSQPGRTQEVEQSTTETQHAASDTISSDAVEAKATVTKSESTSSSTLVSAQQERSDSDNTSPSEAAQRYRSA